MPCANLKTIDFPAYVPAGGSFSSSDVEGSPAHLLQQQLRIGMLAMPERDPARWAMRQRVALIVGSSVALWAAALEITSLFYQAVA